MHRHGYQGRKLGRERDQREALLRGLATSLFTYGKIETTLPKAKELLPYAETLIGKAKNATLHERRQVLSQLLTVSAAHRLVDGIVPTLKERDGGYLRLTKTKLRTGDGSQLAEVSFVDELAPATTTELNEGADNE